MVVRGAEKNLPFPYVIPAQYEYYFIQHVMTNDNIKMSRNKCKTIWSISFSRH